MGKNDSGSGFLLGLLVGVGATVAALALIEFGRRTRAGALPERAAEVGERLAALDRGSRRSRERREKRARRELDARVGRLRTSGL